MPEGSRIALSINSPGGSVFGGQTILHALKLHKGGVDTSVDALAASMASAIFMVGEKRTMAQGARLMMHNVWVDGISGESNTLRKQADLLDSLKTDLVDAYSVSGIDAATIASMMDAETWLTATEAKAQGFCTEISGAMKGAINPEHLNKFLHVPEDILGAIPRPDLQARLTDISGQLKARTVERDSARSALAQVNTNYEALKRSLGLTAAMVVPDIDTEGCNGNDRIMEKFRSFNGQVPPDFYEKHRSHILANSFNS